MAAQVDRLAEILERAHEVHALVSDKTGGVDPDWALFYAWWLLTWSDFPEVLGRTPSIAALTAELIRLDEAYQAGSGNVKWSEAYAERLFGA